MRIRSLLPILLVCLTSQLRAQFPQEVPSVPVEECISIQVRTPSRWWLIIHPDGAALLGRDDHAYLKVPAHSFTFPAAYQALSTLKSARSVSKNDLDVTFSGQHTKAIHALEPSDKEVIRKLFQTGRENATEFDDAERLAKLWSQHPPIP